MKATMIKTMQAAAINQFGGPEAISVQTLPVPQIDEDEVLIRVRSAGVGQWDPYERDGEFDKEFGIKTQFPHALGSDGAGEIAAVGDAVTTFQEGDHVYAMSFLNPKGGFYAQYAAVKAETVSHLPQKLSMEQAGAMAVDAVTALQGLDDTLGLRANETVMIFGALGGVGHLAVQLAKRMGRACWLWPPAMTAWN